MDEPNQVDEPVNPVEAITSAKDARRIMEMGRGGLFMALGGFEVVFGLIFCLNPESIGAPPSNQVSYLLVLLPLAFACAVYFLTRRARQKALESDWPLASSAPLRVKRTGIILAISLAFLGLAGVCATQLDHAQMNVVSRNAVVGLHALLALFFLWRATRYKLWEYALLSSGLWAFVILCGIWAESAAGIAALVCGIAAVICGFSLQARWQKWAAASNETPEHGTLGGARL